MRPLPVIAALTHAFQSVWHNRMVALRMSWIWYAIVAVALAAGSQVIASSGGVDPQSPTPDLILIGMALVILLINSALAVHWHRYILLDEVPGTFDTLRLNGKVWRYFGNTLLIILSTMIGSIIAAIPFILIALGIGTPQLVPLATMLAVLIIISFCFLRLGIKLPSIALGIPDFRFSDAWRVSAGNAFRICALFLVPIATAIIVTLIVKAADQSGV